MANTERKAPLRAMPYNDVVAKLAEETGLTQRDCKAVLEAYVELVVSEVKDGGKIGLPKFGNFDLRIRPARQGRNPQTGESIEIKESKSIGFKIAKAAKESL